MRIPIILGLWLLLPALALAEPDPTMKSKLTDVATQYLAKKNRAGIAIGVTRKGVRTIVVSGAASLKDASKPLTEDSLFELGSITKAITGTLLAEEITRGEASLEMEVSKILPAVKVPKVRGREMQLVDLATHRSGLPRIPANMTLVAILNLSNPYAKYQPSHILADLGNMPDRADDAPYDYSNYGFMLLGHLLAEQSGLSYEELLRTRLTEPLGLNHMFVRVEGQVERDLVDGHSAKGKVAGHWTNVPLPGAGAVVANAGDVLTFLEAQWKPGPLAEALRLASSPHFKDPKEPFGMGLGWHFQYRDGAEPIIWHNGGTGGFHTFCGFTRNAETGLVILTNNADGDMDGWAIGFLDELAP